MPPQLNEVWEGRDITDNMTYRIKHKIVCELVRSLFDANRDVNRGKGGPPFIPPSYSVQMTLTLSVQENAGLNPAVTFNKMFPNGSDSGLTIGQTFNLGLGANLSSTATRVDTAYTYFVVGRIATKRNVDSCEKESNDDTQGSSLLLQSDLGIHDYIVNAFEAVDLLPSSPGGKEAQKPDVFSYDIKFAVVTNGSINPMWKLVRVSGGSSTPLLMAGRMRTHELLLTFGPTAPDGVSPSNASIDQHSIQQQNQSRHL